jgi:formate dehydrogenase beta subunit
MSIFDVKLRDLWWFRKNVPCLDACPVKTDAGRYVQLIAEGRFAEAYRVARSPNPIASVCGRTCGAPCEDACRRGKIDEPVTIRALKRFVCELYGPESLSSVSLREILLGDMGGGSITPGHGERLMPRTDGRGRGRKVAVVGAGPAGLACAHDLAVMGYRPTVFEAMPLPGGMMRYGIPSYRLPREVIDYQVAEDLKMRERLENHARRRQALQVDPAGKLRLSVDRHGAGAAHGPPARVAKRQGGIVLALDRQQNNRG